LRLPLPDLLEEGLAAHLAAGGLALLGQLALDHHLRGDARMVGARLPERVEAAHPVPADQDVLQRVVEGVAHVQEPVTLGGGIMMQNASRRGTEFGVGPGAALKAPSAPLPRRA
jgi:hypothetical protein